jgi:hypothetical protein
MERIFFSFLLEFLLLCVFLVTLGLLYFWIFLDTLGFVLFPFAYQLLATLGLGFVAYMKICIELISIIEVIKFLLCCLIKEEFSFSFFLPCVVKD